MKVRSRRGRVSIDREYFTTCIVDPMPHIVVNGVDDVATRPDPVDRSELVTLSPTPTSEPQRKRYGTSAIAVAAPRISAATPTVRSRVLTRGRKARLPEAPRVADFAATAEFADGCNDCGFTGGHTAHGSDTSGLGSDAGRVGQAVVRFMGDAWERPA